MITTYEELNAIISEKPSIALRHALDALDAFKATPNCEVDMNTYHGYNSNSDTCFACLGGAATVIRLGIPTEDWCQLGGYTGVFNYFIDRIHVPQENLKLASDLINEYESALDEARCGCFSELFKLANIDPIEALTFSVPNMPYYHKEPKEWRDTMEASVKKLEEAGY